MNSQIEELKSFINNSNYTIVITGAGVSVSSGIGDVEHWHLPTVLQMSSEIILKTMYCKKWNYCKEKSWNK